MSLLSGVYAGSYYGGGYGGGSYGNKVASAGNYDRMAANVGSALSDEFSEVAKYFEMGKVDTAFDMYENLEDDVKIVADRYGYSLSDHEYETLLRNAYEHATNSSLDVTINDNTSSSFNTGYKQIISPFAWFSSSNTVSNEEAKARKAGNEASFSSQIHEGAGAAAAQRSGAGHQRQHGQAPHGSRRHQHRQA